LFYQQHVLALVTSHLQVDYFFLVMLNIHLALLIVYFTLLRKSNQSEDGL